MAAWLAAEAPVSSHHNTDGVRVLVIRAFTSGTAPAARRELEGLADGEPVVVDLRGCPGGDLQGAIELLRDLLPAGAEIARVVDEDGDAVVHRARGDRYPVALTVLVDGQTASAAEVFAGCLEGHRRARVIGGPTFGKTTAQAVGVDSRGAAVARTVATVHLPFSDQLEKLR
jgi:carboxyl-terminal processing protease